VLGGRRLKAPLQPGRQLKLGHDEGNLRAMVEHVLDVAICLDSALGMVRADSSPRPWAPAGLDWVGERKGFASFSDGRQRRWRY